MTKKIFYFKLKSQTHYPKIQEGQLIGIAIQSFNNFIHGNCGYLFFSNNQETTKIIQNFEKKRNQEHFFKLEDEMTIEEFKEDIVSNEGENLGMIGRKKIYVES